MRTGVRVFLGALVFLFGLSGNVRPQRASDAEFAKAYELYSREQYAAAKLLLESVLSDAGSALRDYSLYYLARAGMAMEDWDGARARFVQLEREYPNSRLAPDAAFQLARIDLEQKRYDRVIERAPALRDRYENGDLRARASYYQGRAYEGLGQARRAFEAYQAARRQAPRSAWTRESKKRIEPLRSLHPEFAVRGAQAMLEEAQRLYEEGDYTTAEKYYRRALADASHRRSALLGLADVYRKTRQRDKEEEVRREIVRYYPGTSVAGAALARIATIQWNRDDNAAALSTFRSFTSEYPDHPAAAYATYAIGRIHESLGDSDAAIRIYRGFDKAHAQSRYRDDAAWRLAWIHYLAPNFAAAHALFREIAGRPGNFQTAAVFWQARSAEALGMHAQARDTYRALAQGAANPYYQGLAGERLSTIGESPIDSREPEAPEPASLQVQLESGAAFHFVRAQALARIALYRFARLELDRVKDLSPARAELKRLLMREYAAVQAYDASVALAYELPASADTRRYRYPLSYWDIVRRHAGRAGVDPFLVVALIRQESLFNPHAVSPADALGLMQLLQSTARNEAAGLGLPEPGRGRLFDPELNVRLGTHHLKGLLERYGGSAVKALAAYNAGTKPVRRWSRNLGVATDYEFAERITYRETRLYVKKVLRNYWAYKQLYGEEKSALR